MCFVEQKKPGSRPGFSFIGACPDHALPHPPVPSPPPVRRGFGAFARATRSNVFLPRHAFWHTGTRPLLDTDTRLCLGERSVARCRRAADPGRRAVDRQPRRETLMRLPVAAPVGAAVIPGTSRIVARPVRGQHERHDGNLDLVDIVGQTDVAVAGWIFEILRRHPPTTIRPPHLPPGGAPGTPK